MSDAYFHLLMCRRPTMIRRAARFLILCERSLVEILCYSVTQQVTMIWLLPIVAEWTDPLCTTSYHLHVSTRINEASRSESTGARISGRVKLHLRKADFQFWIMLSKSHNMSWDVWFVHLCLCRMWCILLALDADWTVTDHRYGSC